MTVEEAILKTQGKTVGPINRLSANFAQTLLLPGEEPAASVVANVTARRERFPGVIVLTNQRAIAACALPGIRRSIICSLGNPAQCVESPTAICYKATFSDGKSTFSFTVDTESGERFSRCVAVINGEEAAFDAAGTVGYSGIFNPALLRSRQRARQAKERERIYRAVSKEMAAENERARIRKADSDTKAVAKRLAAELAEAEK